MSDRYSITIKTITETLNNAEGGGPDRRKPPTFGRIYWDHDGILVECKTYDEAEAVHAILEAELDTYVVIGGDGTLVGVEAYT